jgi:Fungalysin metallopeptidase (M36)/Ig-like domain CHU_C associated/Immune inhibitor A peptidase M6/Secretion system C-terminal sorting domain/Fungalysin/Thermolysin Propeptide Motif
MKKILLLAIILFSTYLVDAQIIDQEKIAALQLVQKNREALNLSQNDIENSIVSSTYKNKFASTTMVYLQQTFKGIPVYNQLQTIAFKEGKVVSQSGTFIKNIEKIVNVTSELPLITADAALLAAINDRKLIAKEPAIVNSSKENGRKITFSKMGVSTEDITATLFWFPTEEGKKIVKLGWQIYIIQNNSSDYWLVNIDATNKSTISVGNLTVYCNWDANDKIEKHNHTNTCLKTETFKNKEIKLFDVDAILNNSKQLVNSPSLVSNATYRVIPYPAESPLHPGGTPTLVSNPWDLSGASNAATPLKWHSVGATNYNTTRGNNVWAQEDRAGTNAVSVNQVTSSTSPDPLNFDFAPDFTINPTQTAPIQNQQFNTTNLFYWNNIIHDLTYQYGFDEASRNFQADNLGKGGVGGDFVRADAQDGSGVNNANFSSPADGGGGRMQMFLWTTPTPARDGDVDNGVVCHEYAHGISNRLTGSGAGCLGNAEQMGEGWSDYYSLMYTQNWATSNLNTGFTTPRGIGTYANNQTPNGGGIRSQRYCTDFAINNRSYAATISTSQHNRGEIWCATLWDMTWAIINQVGSINPNLFNANAVGGNTIALKLVTEGMKLQPCSPGFIDGRDGILQADQILYGGLYRCAILEAFRRRGMGLGASQGSSGSVTDQIPSFTNGGATLSLIQTSSYTVPEGQNINYTNRVTSDVCVAFSGYTITDTLPLNVTYVSGGTYNPATRVVSFPVTQAANTTVNYNFVVNVNTGTYFAPVTLLNEPVPATMPTSWSPITTVPAAGNLWTITTAQSSSAPNALFCENEVVSSDKRLEMTNAFLIPNNLSSFTKFNFKHKFDTEDGWDGGVVEISTNAGSTWTDLGANILTNKYNSALGAGTGNNLSNRFAYTGLKSTFINTSINLSQYAGQQAKLRFRFASDDNTAGVGTPTGWIIDDLTITDTASVRMRSSLFNTSLVRVATADTLAQIIPSVTAPPLVTTQPSNATTCVGNDVTFNATASGAGLTYSWQVSTNGGTIWTTVSPAVTISTLTLNAVTASMNNNRYRLVVSNSAGSVNSTAALLTVTTTPIAPTVISPLTYCQGITAPVLNASGSNLLWYANAVGGTGSNTAPSPATTSVGSNTYYVSQTVGCESPRASIEVNITASPVAPSVLSSVVYCQGVIPSALIATGSNLLWYTAAIGGVSSTTTPTVSTSNVGIVNYYVSQSAAGCESPRALIAVTTNSTPAAPTVVTPLVLCQGSTAAALTATGTNIKWYTIATGSNALATTPTPITTALGSTTYYASQTTGACEGPRTALVVNIISTPIAPLVAVSNIAYCQGVTTTALSANGTNLLWYNVSTGGTGSTAPITPSTLITGTTIYYVSQSTGACEGPRAAITVNVSAAPAITAQPQDITSCTTVATFNVTATGTNVTYQWQISTDGGTIYTALAGEISSTLVINGLTTAQANNKYRVIVSSGSCNPIISNSVTAKVGTNPVVNLSLTPNGNYNPLTFIGLVASATPNTSTYTYQWKRNTVLVPNVAGNTLTKTNGLIDEFGIYQVSATDALTGCIGVSNIVTIEDNPNLREQLYIAPNPTTGLFRITYYSPTSNTQKRFVNIFNEKGSKVYIKEFSIVGRYGLMNLDITTFAKGSYFLILADENGKKIIGKKIIKN